jgi:hypothetical protein
MVVVMPDGTPGVGSWAMNVAFGAGDIAVQSMSLWFGHATETRRNEKGAGGGK